MNGILAQTAALAAHAKARRFDSRTAGNDYWTRHSTFKYVKTLRFVAPASTVLPWPAGEEANTPGDWLAALPENSVISLVSLGPKGPSHQDNASGIQVSIGGSSGVWIPTWEVSKDRFPQKRIWYVRYDLVPTPAMALSATSIEKARDRLAKILREIAKFASPHGVLAVWCETFREAERMLAAPNPSAPYHPDILPPAGYTLAARQLLAASARGYVFGGMGSWNDGPPSSREIRIEYDRLSVELYASLIEGLEVAVNLGVAA
jgi:hypothetical protein